MTEIERKALELVNEVWLERGEKTITDLYRGTFAAHEALCRAIERREAFRQEVSDAVEEYFDCEQNGSRSMLEVAETRLRRFIIAKPDPLVDALAELNYFDPNNSAKNLYAALAKRGLEIREKNDG